MPHFEWKGVTPAERADRPASRLRVSRQAVAASTRRRFLVGGLAMAAAGLSAEANAASLVVTNLREYRGALARLSPRYKATLIEIGADWCAVCRTIEQRIFPDPRVQRAMERIALIKVDVTKMDQSSRELLQHLGADGPPTLFVVQTASGREYSGTRSVGAFSADHLIHRLSPFA